MWTPRVIRVALMGRRTPAKSWSLRRRSKRSRVSLRPNCQEGLNEPDDATGQVEELNGFFRRYSRSA